MKPIIAMHHRPGSFSDRWIAYCQEHDLPHRLVDAYAPDIIAQLRQADIFLWHWHHMVPRDVLMARHLIAAAEKTGRAVYPGLAESLLYDDKIAQKYFLEAVDAPLVPTRVFYSAEAAAAWIGQAALPQVFKLRRGAGAQNVRLVRTKDEGRALIRAAFGRGFKPVAGYAQDMGAKLKKSRKKGDLLARAMRLPKTLMNIYRINRSLGRERGYIYFQDFIPDNRHDTRIVVIGQRAFAYRRLVRENDFRASGHGQFDFDRGKINPEAVTIAFAVTQKAGAASLAFDFVTGPGGRPLILEISYAFGTEGLHQCEGYFDPGLRWHAARLRAEDAILIDLIERGAGKK